MKFGWPLLALALFSVMTPRGLAGDGPRRTNAAMFLQRHPGDWRVVRAPGLHTPAFIYGDRARLPLRATTLPDLHDAARYLVDENPELFGVSSGDLVLRHAMRLPLARAHTSDKVAVVFDQVDDGVAVFDGSVSVLFDAASGDVLAIDIKTVPFAADASRVPTTKLTDASSAAQSAFIAEFGVPFSQVDDAKPAIIGPSPFFGGRNPLTERGATLAWLLDVSAPGHSAANGAPAVARVFVSAEGDNTVFKVQQRSYPIDGKSTAYANVGSEPSTSTNQELVPVRHAYIRQSNGTGPVVALTDAQGNYSSPISGPTTLSSGFDGPYCRVNHWDGDEHTDVVQNASGTVNFLLNESKDPNSSAQSAAYHHVLTFRDYVRGIDPSDTTMDFQVLAHVNKSDQPCNAYFSQNSINFERAAAGCVNTAYQDIIHHEEAHWANERYTTGGLSKAFHEGNADAFAYYINDDPCITNFHDPTGCYRTALQTAIKKCPNDGDETCHGGDQHIEGQALASALWSVRERLGQSLGSTAGDDAADTLFMAWMRTFNDGLILDVIEHHWLALNDDDGSLANLTPHFAAIHGGFGEYGFKGFPMVSIEPLQHPADNAEVGHFQSVTVTAKLNAPADPLQSATLYYAVNGAPFSPLSMTAAGSGGEYTATIPGVASPDTVRWYISGKTDDGDESTYPPRGAGMPRVYHCGKLVKLASYDFEAAGDQGWTHALLAGSSGDQWERGDVSLSNAPSDPALAYSGTRAWGTDLSQLGFDGMYEPLGSGELRSPVFNFSSEPKVFLQYRRWLALEGNFDRAQVLVDNTIVYQNPSHQHVLDEDWGLQNFDVSALAGGKSAVQFKWRLIADYILEFGGWTIDDVMVYRVDPAPAAYFQEYGAGCPGDGGAIPHLSGVGVPAPGQTTAVDITNGTKMGVGWIMVGLSPAQTALNDSCDILVGGPYLPAPYPVALDSNGALHLPSPIPTGLSGVDFYLQYFADPSLSTLTIKASNGLRAHVE